MFLVNFEIINKSQKRKLCDEPEQWAWANLCDNILACLFAWTNWHWLARKRDGNKRSYHDLPHSKGSILIISTLARNESLSSPTYSIWRGLFIRGNTYFIGQPICSSSSCYLEKFLIWFFKYSDVVKIWN